MKARNKAKLNSVDCGSLRFSGASKIISGYKEHFFVLLWEFRAKVPKQLQMK